MGNAVWLFLALPKWFFSTIMHPLDAHILSVVPALGVIFLLAGLTLGLIGREPRLLLFLFPFAFSQLFVSIAGVLRGQLREASIGLPLLLLCFFAAQVVLVIYLIYYLARARSAAAALAVFSLAYALFALFVASMSFSDDWL